MQADIQFSLLSLILQKQIYVIHVWYDPVISVALSWGKVNTLHWITLEEIVHKYIKSHVQVEKLFMLCFLISSFKY